MEHKLSRAVRALKPSMIREMCVRAEGYPDAISLGIGEPDFDTPQEVCRAALKDALAGATHYTPSRGDPELIEALSRYLAPRYGVELPAAQMQITVGGMGALLGFFRAVLDPGDEVIAPEPCFPAYLAHISFAGGVPVLAPTSFARGFVPRAEDIEALITPRTKAILLNSPNNPTGAVIPDLVLDELAELAVRRDLLVLSDEVYDRLLFTGQPHQSIYTRPGMAARTCVVGSFSKAFAMTGWRLGWIFGPETVITAVHKVVTFNTSCPPSVSQRAGLAALNLDPGVWDAMAVEFQARVDLACGMLEAMDGVRVNRPGGAFYILPDISALADDCERFSLELLDREQVVVVPGDAFGPSGAGCVRLACTVDQARLTEALTRLGRFAAGRR